MSPTRPLMLDAERMARPLDDTGRPAVLWPREREIVPSRALSPVIARLRQGDGERHDRLVIKSGSRLIFLAVEDVQWVEAEGNYARLHVRGESHLIRATMQSLEARLGAAEFVRIHRSAIARIELIAELRFNRDGDCDLVLRNGKQLKVGRAFRAALRDRLTRGL